MSLLGRLLHRVRLFRNRATVEASMNAEMQHHIECETRDRMARGLLPDEARRTALRDFGGVEIHKEDARDRRGFRIIGEFAVDARLTLRTLRRNPGYTTAAVLTFALGAGLATSIFAVVHGVLMRPLPYQAPGRLAVIWESNVARGASENVVTVASFERWRTSSHSLSAVAALVPAPSILAGEGDILPERLAGAEVSPQYFDMLGIRPALGRDFDARDGIPGAPRVTLLSHSLWQLRFGGDSALIGQSIALDGRPAVVIGVMPAGFDPPKFGWLSEQQLWFPFLATEEKRAWGPFLLVVGRLRDGVTLDAAQKEMVSISREAEGEQNRDAGWSPLLVSLTDEIVGDVREPLLVLLGAVFVLLIMAATNVGSLTLGFLRRRERELAIRLAIGASRSRVFRQVASHSVVLGAIGCVAGIITALGGTRLLLSFLPEGVPRADSIRLDGTSVIVATVVAAFIAGIIGAVTAVQAMAAQSRGITVARSSSRTTARLGSGTLVVAEIALGVIVTVFAGLMVRSFNNLRAVPLGFDPSQIVAARVSLPSVAYDSDERRRLFFVTLQNQLRQLPEVATVSFATTRPFACCAPRTTVTNPEQAFSSGEPPSADVRFADSAYFEALRIPVLAGRGFSEREDAAGTPHVLINESMARTLWSGSDPVGHPVNIVLNGGIHGEIIGVVGDMRFSDAHREPGPMVFLSSDRYPSSTRDIIIRSSAPAATVISALRTALRTIDPSLPLSMVTTLRESVDRSLAQDRFTTMVLGLYAIVAMCLAAVGIYGVFAAEVTARHQEIGVRMAFGARGSSVLLLVIRRSLVLSLIGAAAGVSVGLVLSRSLSAMVFEVATSDATAFVSVAVLLLAVAMIATLIPALRAARISPLDAIRGE